MQDIDKLIDVNRGLVYKQLIKFKLTNDPEAESIGFEALYNAILKYDQTRGAELSTVASVYIYNALGSYVRSLNVKRQIQTVSYNATAYQEDGRNHEFLDVLSSGTSVEDDYIHKEMCRYAVLAFDKLYDTLTNENHKHILRLWKESEFAAKTTDISKRVGVSQSNVSQVINIFKHRLKKELEEMYYD